MPTLPEKVIQFGTGILLRGLPDFFIDKANKQGAFNGRIVVVKSTNGDVDEFAAQGNRFKTYLRGIDNGKKIEDEFYNDAISRVLSATNQWQDICDASTNPQIQIIISNTTEVGLQYVEESIFSKPPASFPGKLTALLYARFKALGDGSSAVIIIPTELIPENGDKLKAFVNKLIVFNKLEKDFSSWIELKAVFCNSLVDRIVTRPSESIRKNMRSNEPLAIQTEPYRLWAIQGGDAVREVLSFASATEGVIIQENIDYYSERKLRLLNGTHTISVCLGYLRGHDTAYECMEDPVMNLFIKNAMMTEILPTVAIGSKSENKLFGDQVLDRFHNPFTEHKLLSITLQATMKMRVRNIPTIQRYYAKFGEPPKLLTQGFAAYILFMKAEKMEAGKYYGRRDGIFYEIQDDEAAYFYEQWKNPSLADLVSTICSNTLLWEADLTLIQGFAANVTSWIENFQSTQRDDF